MAWTKFARDVDCPRCGATPARQKWKPRKQLVDLDEMSVISDCNPVDAVECFNCGLVFRVCHFEHDDTYITCWDEIETIPRYCPWCGKEIESD